MAILMVFSAVSWAHMGSATLKANWELRPTSAQSLLRDVFNGACIGFLGVSGFECTPAYIEMIDIKKYPSVINSLIYSVILLNAPLMLLVCANLPLSEIRHGANILSLLAELVAGRWLRILLVVDAMLVLCGTIVTGIFTACSLLKTLAQDGVLPQYFLLEMPFTGQLFVPPAFFLFSCILLYVTSAFQLSILSSVFSVTVLTVLLLVSGHTLICYSLTLVLYSIPFLMSYSNSIGGGSPVSFMHRFLSRFWRSLRLLQS
jgi:amino acid transporter